MKRMSFLLLFFLVWATFAFADDYKKYAEEVRAEVWAWDKPEFQIKDIPAKYNTESAVIIASHRDLEAKSKSKFRVNLALDFKVNRELFYTDITRKLIKINDKAALDYYSDLSFKEVNTRKSYFLNQKMQTVVGVRIIKPDGTVKTVDVDKEAVAVKEGKKDKEAYKKMAIPDLQVGDILDYFVSQDVHVDQEDIPDLDFLLADRYPVMNYSVHCEINPKFAIEYRSLNGAPEFTVSNNEEKDILFDLSLKDLPKMPNTLWISMYREFPVIRLRMVDNKNKNLYRPKTARSAGLYKDLDPKLVYADKMDVIINQYKWVMNNKLEKAVRKNIERFKKNHPQATKKQLADYIYEAFFYEAFGYTMNYSGIPMLFYSDACTLWLAYIMREHMECEFGCITGRYGARANEVLTASDLTAAISIDHGKTLYILPSDADLIHKNLYYPYEGETASFMEMTTKRKFPVAGEGTQYTVPFSPAEQNRTEVVLNVSFAGNDVMQLNMNRKETMKGFASQLITRNLFNHYRYNDEVRAYLGEKTNYVENMEETRRQKKYIDDYLEGRKKQEESFPDSVTRLLSMSHQTLEVKNVKNPHVLSTGLLPNAREVAYTVDYTLDGVVKKAGSNYVFDIGKLIDKQLSLDEEERMRMMDVYMPYARSFATTINVALPHGYRVDNVQALNMNEANSAATFLSKAELKGNTLTLYVEKKYQKAMVPVAEWNDLIKVINAANDFYAKSVLLRK